METPPPVKGAASDSFQAASWYRLYLKHFPQGEDAPHINFLLAEALFGWMP